MPKQMHAAVAERSGPHLRGADQRRLRRRRDRWTDRHGPRDRDDAREPAGLLRDRVLADRVELRERDRPPLFRGGPRKAAHAAAVQLRPRRAEAR